MIAVTYSLGCSCLCIGEGQGKLGLGAVLKFNSVCLCLSQHSVCVMWGPVSRQVLRGV